MADEIQIPEHLRKFVPTEEVDGHRWGKFEESNMLGGRDWEICYHCGMIRRRDKQNSPCKGKVRIGLRKASDGT